MSIPTGSPEEREAFRKANNLNKLAAKEETGLAIRIRVARSMKMGSDFDIFAHITNDTEETRACRLLLCARTVSYNGTLGPVCSSKDLLDLSLEPHSGKALCPWTRYGPPFDVLGRALSPERVPFASPFSGGED